MKFYSKVNNYEENSFSIIIFIFNLLWMRKKTPAKVSVDRNCEITYEY